MNRKSLEDDLHPLESTGCINVFNCLEEFLRIIEGREWSLDDQVIVDINLMPAFSKKPAFREKPVVKVRKEFWLRDLKRQKPSQRYENIVEMLVRMRCNKTKYFPVVFQVALKNIKAKGPEIYFEKGKFKKGPNLVYKEAEVIINAARASMIAMCK